MVRGSFFLLLCGAIMLLVAPVGFADGGAPNDNEATTNDGQSVSNASAINAVNNPFLFVDVPADHWAVEDLKFLVEYGVITGLPNGAYNGDSYLTRYSAAAMQARALRLLISHPDLVSQSDLDALQEIMFQTSERMEALSARVEAVEQGTTVENATATMQRLNETQAELAALRVEFEQLKSSAPQLGGDQVNQLKQKANMNFVIAIAGLFVGVIGIALATML